MIFKLIYLISQIFDTKESKKTSKHVVTKNSFDGSWSLEKSAISNFSLQKIIEENEM